MPPLKTTPAARGGGVLRHKDRMATIWGLLAISVRELRCESLVDESTGMLQDRLQSSLLQIALLPVGQTKPLAKG